jgi:nucleotide-binding universal stress UspA family protein
MSAEIRRILVPMDGSSEAEVAIGAIMPLARAYAPEVIVFCVLEGPEPSLKVPAYLAKACAALRANNVNASLDVREGRPAEQIAAYAKEKEVDLIAISTHGRTGMRRILMGSVTEEVLRRTTVPVLVCRPGTVMPEWRRILVALDGSPRAEAILEDLVPLARKLNVPLHLVKAALPVVSGAGVGEFPIVIPAEDPMPYLNELAGRLRAQGVEARPVGLEGRAAFEVLRHAAETGANLIAMTTHGRTGLARVLLGSIAEEILRHAPCPVLVRRTQGTAVETSPLGARSGGVS